MLVSLTYAATLLLLLKYFCAKMMTEYMLSSSLYRKKAGVKVTYPIPVPSISSKLILDQDIYLVHGLPALPDGLFKSNHWAGEIPIPYAGEDYYGNIFFWLFEPADGMLDDKPLVIWLNGGPGETCDILHRYIYQY